MTCHNLWRDASALDFRPSPLGADSSLSPPAALAPASSTSPHALEAPGRWGPDAAGDHPGECLTERSEYSVLDTSAASVVSSTATETLSNFVLPVKHGSLPSAPRRKLVSARVNHVHAWLAETAPPSSLHPPSTKGHAGRDEGVNGKEEETAGQVDRGRGEDGDGVSGRGSSEGRKEASGVAGAERGSQNLREGKLWSHQCTCACNQHGWVVRERLDCDVSRITEYAQEGTKQSEEINVGGWCADA